MRVRDVLADEDVLDGLVLEDAAAGLGDGGLGELAVLVQRGDGGLLDDVVDLFLVQLVKGLQGLQRVGDQRVDDLCGVRWVVAIGGCDPLVGVAAGTTGPSESVAVSALRMAVGADMGFSRCEG